MMGTGYPLPLPKEQEDGVRAPLQVNGVEAPENFLRVAVLAPRAPDTCLDETRGTVQNSLMQALERRPIRWRIQVPGGLFHRYRRRRTEPTHSCGSMVGDAGTTS